MNDRDPRVPDELDLLGCFRDQCRGAAVQVAHGRDKADLLAFTAGAGDSCTQLADGFNSVHAENPCSAPGKLTALTSVT